MAQVKTSQTDRQAFYGELTPRALAPLWEELANLVPKQPAVKAVPHAWHYRDVRPLLMKSGGMLTAEEAIRRVLVFENPELTGQSRINDTVFSGMQLILPGETAPSHKHTAGALRFVLESNGGYTTVDGERTTMHRGDLVITPSGTFHDHGHDGDGPAIWIDGLDLHIVNFFASGFATEGATNKQAETKLEGHSVAAFGSGLLPMETGSPFGATSPVFAYPYARAREAIMALPLSAEPDPHLGYALHYANPLTGGWTMPTLATWLVHLPKGTRTRPYRATDHQAMVVVEGAVTVDYGDTTFSLEDSDIMALPGWKTRSLTAESDCILFFFSDRAAQEKMGLWQEEKA